MIISTINRKTITPNKTFVIVNLDKKGCKRFGNRLSVGDSTFDPIYFLFL